MSQDSEITTGEEQTLESGGVYEVIRKRLEQQGGELRNEANQLNEKRETEFGSSGMNVAGSARVRTENNCVPRDIVSVGEYLLFGYNVFIGLRTETNVSDVFSLFKINEEAADFELDHIPLQNTFLDDPDFKKDFQDLYQYYKTAHLVQLRRGIKGKLLAVFQVGTEQKDQKVFRWSVSPEGEVEYIDNRGEHDNVIPPSHDFEWIQTTRDDHVRGTHSHINILNEVFVETIGGDLTIKVEDNTEDGMGIYSEDVDDPNQSLQDAQIFYARVGVLILLKIRPYKEKDWRYFIYNTRTEQVKRIDELGDACIQLPEDHGVIYPGGYYLQNGESKTFDADVTDMYFLRKIVSPNGEDVFYVFYHYEDGRFILLSYNLIRKELEKPIVCNGYALMDNGSMVIFKQQDQEATRVHPVQLWETQFTSDEYAASAPKNDSWYGKIGNADLVRAISDVLGVCRTISNQRPTIKGYEDLISSITRIVDSYYWLDNPEAGTILKKLKNISSTSEQVLDEFEKVQAIRSEAQKALKEAQEKQKSIIRKTGNGEWSNVEGYTEALSELRRQRGSLITLKDLRYIDLEKVESLENEIVESFQFVSERTVAFLLQDNALAPYIKSIEELSAEIEAAERRIDIDQLIEKIEKNGEGLNILTEVINQLKIDDANARTEILENISSVFSKLNKSKAEADIRRNQLLEKEDIAEFGAQFLLLSQSVTNAIAMADTPEKADEQLSRLLLQLEELDGRFGENEKFVADLAEKREEIYEVFESRKQGLIERRQQKIQSLFKAAERIIDGLVRRAKNIRDVDELNAYFASDAMSLKVREVVQDLRELGDDVKADDLEGRIKAALDNSIRVLRDKSEIFEDGGNTIKLGNFSFFVNTQELDLTIIPRDGDLVTHLTGTDYYEVIDNEALERNKSYLEQSYISENHLIYRAEYLAYLILHKAETGEDGLSLAKLASMQASESGLEEFIKDFSQARYEEGYERGVHDNDAALILEKLIHLRQTSGMLRFDAEARSLAQLFWSLDNFKTPRELWSSQCAGFGKISAIFGISEHERELVAELKEQIGLFAEKQQLVTTDAISAIAAEYLVEELKNSNGKFIISSDALELSRSFEQYLNLKNLLHDFEQAVKDLHGNLKSQMRLVYSWINGFVNTEKKSALEKFGRVIKETVVSIITKESLERESVSINTVVNVGGLLGQHKLINDREIRIDFPKFLGKMALFINRDVSAFREARSVRSAIVDREREALKLNEFKPQPITSFVRNKLINDLYLPIIGDNLAKQMGAAGAGKRTDLMGMLLLISPPGYGKTTLMEYVANRLGLVFMKINCPTIGHGVVSIDPAEAPNAAAKQELEKLNLGLEMGNNVMLYLDDIQHSNPELLQKFISLCDAQRKIEGVWKGKAKTYDLRGKKFCVIMAGNPYTESGEAFTIPDMLANRADVYNLGDVLSGHKDAFELSYLENCLTSNQVMAPLSSRSMEDFYKLVRMARGEQIPTSELKHNYSGAEVSEIVSVLKHLIKVQQVILKVNSQYILSASQDDAYRTEPPFKLQGSYRNMSRMAEKIVAVMNEEELEALVTDHYVSEAQTLTSGAEENLLKLAEMRGVMTDEQQQRWQEIKAGYARRKSMEGEDDPVSKVAGQINLLAGNIGDIHSAILEAAQSNREPQKIISEKLDQAVEAISKINVGVQVNNQPVPGLKPLLDAVAGTIDGSLLPVVKAMEHKLRLDHDIWDTLNNIVKKLKSIDKDSFAEINMKQEVRDNYTSE